MLSYLKDFLYAMDAAAARVNAYAVVFTILVLTIVVLGFVVYIQNRKLRELREPKFGFLGKPLTVFAISIFVLSSFGYLKYQTLDTQKDNSVSVNAKSYVVVNFRLINSDNHLYSFNATPYVDDVAWGRNGGSFSVYWTITDVETGNIKTAVEFELSEKNSGGIEWEITESSKVEATIYINGIEISDDVIITP